MYATISRGYSAPIGYTSPMLSCIPSKMTNQSLYYFLFLVSVSPMTPQISTTSYRLPSQPPISVKSIENGEPVLAPIGALMALSVVLLAVVTTGWVCTCIYMKNKMATDHSRQTR
jgi:hypothetical protein